MSCSICNESATCSNRVGDSGRQLFCSTCYPDDKVQVATVVETSEQQQQQLIGKPTFEQYSLTLAGPRELRQGSAKGVTVFTQLAKLIGQRIIQVKMRENQRIPFEVIPLRDLMVQQHCAYYHAGTYFAEWFGGVHKDAKLFARLLEDAVDAAIELKPVILRTLLDTDPHRHKSAMRDMMSEHDRERVTDIARFAQRQRAAVGGLIPEVWRQRLHDLFALQPAQANTIAAAWRDHALESLQVGLIYLQDWRTGPALYSSVFLGDFVTEFTQFAQAMFTASRRVVPVRAASTTQYWE